MFHFIFDVGLSRNARPTDWEEWWRAFTCKKAVLYFEKITPFISQKLQICRNEISEAEHFEGRRCSIKTVQNAEWKENLICVQQRCHGIHILWMLHEKVTKSFTFSSSYFCEITSRCQELSCPWFPAIFRREHSEKLMTTRKRWSPEQINLTKTRKPERNLVRLGYESLSLNLWG